MQMGPWRFTHCITSQTGALQVPSHSQHIKTSALYRYSNLEFKFSLLTISTHRLYDHIVPPLTSLIVDQLLQQEPTVCIMSNQAGPEKTFRSYTSEQGKAYAKHRMTYSQALYQDIISHHTSTGGKRDTVLDLGCGPGTATFALARFFDNAIGLDPSTGMVTTARSLLVTEAPRSNVKFEVSTAEDIDPSLIPDSSVDLITAATCAHVSHPG